MSKEPLYIHVGKATHFLRWELPEFAKWFDLVDEPGPGVRLLSFGPDALEEAAELPALARFAVLFPGFSHNPVRDLRMRELHHRLIQRFDAVFINPGPLELAYAGLANVELYPFSVDVALIGEPRPRTRLDSLLHVSHDNPQKDWRRSEAVLVKSGLRHEVFPPRDPRLLEAHVAELDRRSARRASRGGTTVPRLPVGYFSHEMTIRKYFEYDGFVHVARDVRHPEFIDGKYTASLIEAGLTGALLFWHDTWGLGNGLETVFELPVNTDAAVERIHDIRSSLDIEKHSRSTAEEMRNVFNPGRSVAIRAERMLAAV